MKFERFEEIIAWQKAKEMTVAIYRVMEESRDFGFRGQIERASVSIMNNIAEGFERKSNNEFKQFLFIAKGSCGEVRSMLLLAKELEKMNKTTVEQLLQQTETISRMLSNLIKVL